MISICIVTRGRPESYKRLCLSILDNASDPAAIEFITYRDNDDESIYEYMGNHHEIIGDRILYAQMWNECQKLGNGDIFMLVADDFIFETKGWDVIVNEAFDAYPDKIALIWPNDKVYKSRFASVFFLHKNWVDVVGYAVPPYFSSQYIDNWLNDVSQIINRRHFLREMVVRHHWISDDATHIEYMNRKKTENARALYKSKIMVDRRHGDAKKLQEFIDNFNGNESNGG